MSVHTIRLTLVAEGDIFGEANFTPKIEFLDDGVVVNSRVVEGTKVENGVIEAILVAADFAQRYALSTTAGMAKKAGSLDDFEKIKELAAARGIAIADVTD